MTEIRFSTYREKLIKKWKRQYKINAIEGKNPYWDDLFYKLSGEPDPATSAGYMNEQDILKEFKAAEAILSGHFILSSGLHSSTYLQCARVMMDAARGEHLCKALADKIRAAGHVFDAIVAPAMGGVVVGYEMGRQLNIPTMFCERVDGSFQIRRGFSLNQGAKVLVVEDVVTTGKSSMEAVACIKEAGGVPLAVCSLIDRRGSNDTSLTLPLISLLKLDVPTYKPDALPDELKNVPAIKPGSRWLKAAG